jgi:hypothetical protein
MLTAPPTPELRQYPPALAKITYRATGDVIGDGNYFRQSAVSPYVDRHGTLVVTDGYGARRYWGTPRCLANVEWLSRVSVEIFISWSNKHYYGKARYYFLFEVEARRWKKIHRLSVLERLAPIEEAKLGTIPPGEA